VVIKATEATKGDIVHYTDSSKLAEDIFRRLNHHVLLLKKDYLAELMGSMLTTSSNSYEADLSNLILEQMEEVTIIK
jgi:hypothetical protein